MKKKKPQKVKNEPDQPSLTSASSFTRSGMTGSFPKAVMVGMEEGQLAREGPEWRGIGRGATSWHRKMEHAGPNISTKKS